MPDYKKGNTCLNKPTVKRLFFVLSTYDLFPTHGGLKDLKGKIFTCGKTSLMK